jgi:hypothetical protein
MSELPEVQFRCIGCGALNPPGAEVCVGCGHRFAGLDGAPVERRIESETPHRATSPDTYDPPSSPIAGPRKLRIGTAMGFIALIAVCMGTLRVNIALGVALSVLLLLVVLRPPFQLVGTVLSWIVLILLAVAAFVITLALALIVTFTPAGRDNATLVKVVGVVVSETFAIGILYSGYVALRKPK